MGWGQIDQATITLITQILTDLGIVDTNINNITDCIGAKTDFLPIPFNPLLSSIIGYLQTGYYHNHGRGFVYPTYAQGVQLVAHNSAWGTSGTVVEIIPAAFLSDTFKINHVSIYSVSEQCEGILDLYAGAVHLGAVEFFRLNDHVTDVFGIKPFNLAPIASGNAIRAAISTSTVNATTVRVKLYCNWSNV